MDDILQKSIFKKTIGPSDRQIQYLVELYSQGQLQQALIETNKILQQHPNSVTSYNIQGAVNAGLQNFDAAIESYLKAIELKPDFFEAYNNMGVAQQNKGELDTAIENFKEAINIKPDYAEAFNNMGIALMKKGYFSSAKNCYKKAIIIKPNYAEAYNNLGNCQNSENDVEAAINSYKTSLQIKPDNSEAYNNMGIILKNKKMLDEAINCFKKAIKINPNYAEAYSNMGGCMNDKSDFEGAIKSYKYSLRINPNYFEAYNSLGAVYHNKGNLNEAINCFKKSININIKYADAYNNMGVTLFEIGSFKDAEISYRKALNLNPNYAEAYFHLGITLQKLGRYEEARLNYSEAISLNHNYHDAFNNMGVTLQNLGRFEEAEVNFRQAINIKPDYIEYHDNLLFLQSINDFDYNLYHKSAEDYVKTIQEKINSKFLKWSCVQNPQRLRVGFVSGDFKNHPVGYFLEGLLTQLKSSNLDLYAFPTIPLEDELTTRIKSNFYCWEPIWGKSDKQAADLIYNHNINILIDLSGHTNRNRLPVFAFKPAPVQVSWLGYWASSCLPEIDYLLGDPYVTPYNESHHFSEKIWQLPESYLCFTEPNTPVNINSLPELSNGNITFGCFNKLLKMTDEVISLRSRILKKLPGAKLYLKDTQLQHSSVKEEVFSRYANHGIYPEQLILEGPSKRAEYLACYNRVDITLSPFPYGGGTTTVEGLWMGVPVIAKRGNYFLSHLGESIAHNTGLSDWIANDEDDYLNKALQLSSNLDDLAKLRCSLRAQILASPLFNASRFANHFESAMWDMWNK